MMLEIDGFLINNHSGIKRLELLHLGKINVLCGKNNSGKSTIARALSDLRDGKSDISFRIKVPFQEQVQFYLKQAISEIKKGPMDSSLVQGVAPF